MADDVLKLEYEQAQEWCRHYSNVRMTVVPALAGLSVTLLSLNWPDTAGAPPNPAAALGALVFWVAAMAFLWMFTALEVREQWYSRLLRVKLGGLIGSASEPRNVLQRYAAENIASLEIRRLTFWDSQTLCLDPLKDIPLWVGMFLSAVFGMLLWFFFQQFQVAKT